MSVSDESPIRRAIDASIATLVALREQETAIHAIGECVVATLKAGGKIMTAGNGGSAAEALHMAEELSGRYRGNRRSLAGLSLVADTTALTCIGNDFGFDHIFSRQLEGLGRAGDVLVLFSTSGCAANLERALATAKQQGITVVALLGRDGGKLAGRCDHEVIVAGTATERIQEAHQVVLHLILDAVEDAFPATD